MSSDKIKCHECGTVILLKECKFDCKHTSWMMRCSKRKGIVIPGGFCQYYESKYDEEKKYIDILITKRNGD